MCLPLKASHHIAAGTGQLSYQHQDLNLSPVVSGQLLPARHKTLKNYHFRPRGGDRQVSSGYNWYKWNFERFLMGRAGATLQVVIIVKHFISRKTVANIKWRRK